MFKKIYIEISNLCNVQCSFCPIVERDKKVMSSAEFKGVISKLVGHTEEVSLHLMGEPTAHPELEEILDICTYYKIPVNLTTNGLLIKRKSSKIIESSIIRQVNFSLQSYKDNFPHKDLKNYLKPIFEFTQTVFNQRPEMYINYRLWNIGSTQENEEFFQAIEEFFELTIKRNIQVENIKSKKLKNRLYLHFDSRFEWPSPESKLRGNNGRCHGLKSHIGIHADGTVVPCCLDKEAVINLGNIKNQSLPEILGSELATKMREGFSKNQLYHDLCKRCEYIQRFNKK